MTKDVAPLTGVSKPPGPPVGLGNFDLLSTREIQVVQLVVEGLTNYQIGKKLYLDESTIKTHLRTICRKLQIKKSDTHNTRLVVAVQYTRYMYFFNKSKD